MFEKIRDSQNSALENHLIKFLEETENEAKLEKYLEMNKDSLTTRRHLLLKGSRRIVCNSLQAKGMLD